MGHIKFNLDPHSMFKAGVLVPNYIVDTGDLGAGNDKWTSTTVQTYTVPAGKFWLLQCGSVFLSDNATCVVTITDGTNTLGALASHAATTGWVEYPEYTHIHTHKLDAGYTIVITCGVAQGATAKASCLVLEFDA